MTLAFEFHLHCSFIAFRVLIICDSGFSSDDRAISGCWHMLTNWWNLDSDSIGIALAFGFIFYFLLLLDIGI